MLGNESMHLTLINMSVIPDPWAFLVTTTRYTAALEQSSDEAFILIDRDRIVISL